MTIAPTIARVEIRKEEAATSATGRDGLVVVATFDTGHESHGIALGASSADRKLAERLAAGIKAGKVFTDPTLRTRPDGSTWVSYGTQVIGRRLNADLKRLGF